MDKYIIDGVEYCQGEEVEVSNDKEIWVSDFFRKHYKENYLPILCSTSWKYIRKIQPTKCEHESDGNDYLSNPPQYKCKKCGEFYKTLISSPSLSGRKAKLTLDDGTVYSVVVE